MKRQTAVDDCRKRLMNEESPRYVSLNIILVDLTKTCYVVGIELETCQMPQSIMLGWSNDLWTEDLYRISRNTKKYSI